MSGDYYPTLRYSCTRHNRYSVVVYIAGFSPQSSGCRYFGSRGAVKSILHIAEDVDGKVSSLGWCCPLRQFLTWYQADLLEASSKMQRSSALGLSRRTLLIHVQQPIIERHFARVVITRELAPSRPMYTGIIKISMSAALQPAVVQSPASITHLPHAAATPLLPRYSTAHVMHQSTAAVVLLGQPRALYVGKLWS